MAEIASLIDDIYHILDDRTDHTVSDENVNFAGELFKDILRRRFTAREEKRGEAVLRFSALGKKDRQLWYMANKPEAAEPLHPKQQLKFLYGDVIEILLLFLAKEAGHEVTDTQKGVECDGIKGSIDARIDGVLVDVKSASSYSFAKFESGGFVFDDPFGYVSQLSGYATAEGDEQAAFFVADKVHGDLTLAPLDKEYVSANPPGPRIAHLRGVVAQDTPPTRCYDDIPEGKSGNRKLALGCSYCPFKNECWADANKGEGLKTYLYSRGPVFLTHVAKEPRVDAA